MQTKPTSTNKHLDKIYDAAENHTKLLSGSMSK